MIDLRQSIINHSNKTLSNILHLSFPININILLRYKVSWTRDVRLFIFLTQQILQLLFQYFSTHLFYICVLFFITFSLEFYLFLLLFLFLFLLLFDLLFELL